MSNEMTEWRRQMQAKFDNIMSGHKVNEDDRDWLRALLDARLRGEAEQREAQDAAIARVGAELEAEAARGEQQAVAFDAVGRLPAEWRKRWDTAESDHKPALNLWMAAGELEAALSAAPAAPAPVAGDVVTEDMVRTWAWKLQKAMRYTESGHRCDIRTAADAVFQSMTAALAQDRASQGAAAGVPEGWRLVPVKASVTMHNAAVIAGVCGNPPKLSDDGRIEWRCADPTAVWSAMLAAAPSAPTQGAEREVGCG